jgi:CheY-like chemotaxis protein
MRSDPGAEESATILLVDDNSNGLAARRSVLEQAGYRIATARNGHEALERLSAAQFDLIVTDYKMPKMNGIDLIREVRATGGRIPVILLSGFADAMGFTEKNTGADLVIQKSATEIGQLMRGVHRLLARKTPKKPATSQAAAATAKRKQI